MAKVPFPLWQEMAEMVLGGSRHSIAVPRLASHRIVGAGLGILPGVALVGHLGR